MLARSGSSGLLKHLSIQLHVEPLLSAHNWAHALRLSKPSPARNVARGLQVALQPTLPANFLRAQQALSDAQPARTLALRKPVCFMHRNMWTISRPVFGGVLQSSCSSFDGAASRPQLSQPMVPASCDMTISKAPTNSSKRHRTQRAESDSKHPRTTAASL